MLDRTTPPPVYMMGKLSLPTPDTEILPNGIKLRYSSGGTQDVNQLSILWSGGLTESPNRYVAKLMGTMLREGTTEMSGTDISEAIDFNGAMLKIDTDSHYTSLNMSVLNSKTLAVQPIARDIITSPTFPEETFKLYRDIEAKEFLLSQNKVMTQSMQLLSKMIKGSSHIQATIPTVESIKHVTVDEVRNFYDRAITASGCTAYLSGNLTAEVYEAVKDMLSSLPTRGSALQQNIVQFKTESPGREDIDMPNAVQASVCIGIPAPSRASEDYVPLRFTVMALGGYFGSRLMKNIREDKGYTYGIGAYLIGSQEGSYVLISAQADKSYVDPLIYEVGVELQRLATEPLSEDELICLKQHISSTLMETLDSPFSIMDYYKVIESVGLPAGYFDNQVSWTKRIDQQTIMDMAKKYLKPELMRIAVCK